MGPAGGNQIHIAVNFNTAAALGNIQNLNVAIAGIGKATTGATNQANKGLSSMTQQIRQLTSALGAYFSISAAKKTIFDAASIDSLNKQLLSVEGNALAAGIQMKLMIERSKLPGLSLEPLIGSFVALRQLKIPAGEALKLIEEMGNSLALMGKGGVELGLVMEQVVQSLGKGGAIMQEDLKFITQRIPQIRMAMEKVFGVSSTEALAKKFPGMKALEFWQKIIPEMEKFQRAQTGLQKQLDLLGDSWKRVSASIGEDLSKVVLPPLIWIVDKLEQWVALTRELAKARKEEAPWWDMPATRLLMRGVAHAGAGAGNALGLLPPTITPPRAPGLPPGWEAVSKAGPGKKEPGDAEKAFANRLRDAAQQAARAVQDATADYQRMLADFGTAQDRLKADIEAVRLDMERKRQQYLDSLELKKLPASIAGSIDAEEAQRIKTVYDKRRLEDQKYRDEEIRKQREFLDEYVQEWHEANVKVMMDRSEKLIQYWDQERELLLRTEEAQVQMTRQAADHRRDVQLAQLDEMSAQVEMFGQRSLDQQLAIADKRLEIEQEYVAEALRAGLDLLNLDKERELAALRLKAIQDGMLNNPAYDDVVKATEKLYDLRRDSLTTQASDQRELARLKNVADQAKIIRSEMQKTFDYFARLAEGIFDALLDKSKSVTQALGDFVKQTFLTVIKALYSQMIAGFLTRLVYGGGGGAGAGATRSGGGWGNLGGIFSGGGNRGGFTGLPIPGLGLGGGGTSGGWGGWGGGTFPSGGGYGATGAGGGGGYGGMLGGLSGYGRSGLGLLRGLGSLGRNTGQVAGLGPAFSVPGVGAPGGMSAGSGVGGALGGAMLLGGAALAGYGLYKGGWKGVGMSTAGGALIGAKFGAFAGPMGIAVGAAIGAGIGFTAGMIRKMFKSASEKTRQKIKEVYGIDIASQGILSQITQIIKTQYGGDINVGVYSPEVQEMVKLYAMTQGQSASGMGRPMTPVSWAMSGGSASIQPVYSGGHVVANPYTGPTTTELAYSRSPLFISLNPEQANQLFEGRVVQVIGDNPNPVGDAAAASASGASARRSHTQSAILEPMTVLS